MDIFELIMTRKSVRTFDGRPLAERDRQSLIDYAATIQNPFDISIDFLFLDAEEHGLSSPVINGEHLYVAGKVPMVPNRELAFGYSFEKLVLYAWSLGVGTTWIGGTMDRALFEQEAGKGDGEIMPIVSPLGYPAVERAEVDRKLRAGVHGDDRLDPAELFFEKDFTTPMDPDVFPAALEAVRWAPSAVNIQPWRVVEDDNAFHFYEKHSKGFTASTEWDVQAIDMGIAICHFMSVAGGTLEKRDPGIETDEATEYMATVVIG